MSDKEEESDKLSFDREFCEHLEGHLSRTFANSDDKKLTGLWCDGVLDPAIEYQLTKKSVNDTRTMVTTAFIGYDGQDKYEMIIEFGKYSLRKYSTGSSMIDCIPSDETMDWITLDIEKKKIEIRLN
jgi:hypothetical protein